MSNKRVRAVVRVILDVESESVWASDTTFDQITKQACDDVRGLLTSGNDLALKNLTRRIRGLEVVEVKVAAEDQKR